MAHKTQNFDLHAGDEDTLAITITNEAGAAINITGAALRFGMARRLSDPAPLVEKSDGAGITITDGPNGQCEIALAKADTVKLSGSYAYEIEAIPSGGKDKTVLNGTIEITPSLLQ